MIATSLPGIRAEALAAIERLITDNEGLPPEALCSMLSDLRGFISDLRELEAAIESEAVKLMVADDRKLVRIGRVSYEWKSSTKTTWDDPLLAGEMQSVQELLECASIAYWRKGKLKAKGIDPERYSQTEYGRKRLVESIVADDEPELRPDGREAVHPHQGRADRAVSPELGSEGVHPDGQ